MAYANFLQDFWLGPGFFSIFPLHLSTEKAKCGKYKQLR